MKMCKKGGKTPLLRKGVNSKSLVAALPPLPPPPHGPKELSQAQFNEWKAEHHRSAVALNAVYDLVEKDLRLVGATADKDKQQDGVRLPLPFLILLLRLLLSSSPSRWPRPSPTCSSPASGSWCSPATSRRPPSTSITARTCWRTTWRTSRTSWTGTGRRRSPGSSSATAGRSKIFKDFKYFLLGPVLPHGHVKY